MGKICFLVPHADRLSDDSLGRAYLSGPDGVPWNSQVVRAEETIQFLRQEDESGILHIAWPVAGFGLPVLSTTNLMEREAPYLLPVELARGTLNRLRNQLSIWEQAGLAPSVDVRELLRESEIDFIAAASTQVSSPQTTEAAERSIEKACQAISRLLQDYTEQALALRHRESDRLPTLLAVRVDSAFSDTKRCGELAGVFSAAHVDTSWALLEPSVGNRQFEVVDRQVKLLQQSGMRLCAGPVLQLAKEQVPAWLEQWEGDFANLDAYVRQQAKAVVQQYRGQVNLWNGVTLSQGAGVLSLSEEEELRLAVATLEVIRQNDPQSPLVVSFAQPWAESMATEATELPPMHVADALLRADLGISAIGLELNYGYWPGGTLPRDLLEISRQIDRWSLLESPLLVWLTIPSAASDSADSNGASGWAPTTGCLPGDLSASSQAAFAEQVVRLLLSKHAVQGVFWNQLDDASPAALPSGGLYDADRQEKPILQTLRQLSHLHLASR